MTITLHPVSSSCISAVGYDGYTLRVEFHSGRVYDHPGVPYEVYVGLLYAPSVGTYHNQNVRGRYK